jgi:glycosyltransferase involved in cell wall biosynthesis
LSTAEISVAICTYNREKYLPQLFSSIVAQTLAPERFEILLIDNNSPGNTKELFAQFSAAQPSFSCHYFLETNQGLSHARNRAIAEATAPLITFLDDDAFIAPNYLETLVEAFTQYPDCGAVGGPIHLHYEEIKPNWENKYLNSLLGYFDKGLEPFVFEKDYPRGSNMAFRTQIFQQIGMFNVELGRIGKRMYGGEEKDLFNRIYSAKIPVRYAPEAMVYHCVPLERTTFEFIKKQALGTGISERLRSKNEGSLAYLKRLFSEKIKWVGSAALWFNFAIRGQFAKGNMILFFRFWVTRGLLFKYDGA